MECFGWDRIGGGAGFVFGVAGALFAGLLLEVGVVWVHGRGVGVEVVGELFDGPVGVLVSEVGEGGPDLLSGVGLHFREPGVGVLRVGEMLGSQQFEPACGDERRRSFQILLVAGGVTCWRCVRT